MKAKTRDSKTFYRLVNSHRSKPKLQLEELIVGENTYSTPEDILQGWKKHFETLATCTANEHENYTNTEFDQEVILDICGSDNEDLLFTQDEVAEAINSLNNNKAPDIFGITAEHLKYGGEMLVNCITRLLNIYSSSEHVPQLIKLGILTPIFKKKGKKQDAKNYRGITVLPILGKCLEFLLRKRLRTIIDKLQNRLQRGFTKSVSPMNCALVLYECLLNSADAKIPIHVAFLDAKSAFDVVGHTSLFRKLFLAGVNGRLWLLTYLLNQGAQTAVKWEHDETEPFDFTQGVRQGGVLSTDLYKLYVNDVLNQIEESGIGTTIGTIPCAAPTCADDISLLANSKDQLQILINTVENYSKQENYKLQPAKCAIFTDEKPDSFIINDNPVPQPETTVHLGITHHRNSKKTIATHIQANIEKARRTMYSLMGAGLHGMNGLNPASCLHILNVYVLPILLYGLEILLPSRTELMPLETFYRKTLKQILSIPINTPDAAVYILAGTCPLESHIHKKALGLYANICRTHDSVEKEIAERQLCMKGIDGNSWFSKIRQILAIYDLTSSYKILDEPPTKNKWKQETTKFINQYWKEHVSNLAQLYSSIRCINASNYEIGKLHPTLESVTSSARDVARLPIKLKIMTGTYHLQSTKAAFNQNKVNPTCLLCNKEAEDTEHFLLNCIALDETRQKYLESLRDQLLEAPCLIKEFTANSQIDQSCVLNPSALFIQHSNCNVFSQKKIQLEHISRSLCFALHLKRTNILNSLPSINRKGS